MPRYRVGAALPIVVQVLAFIGGDLAPQRFGGSSHLFGADFHPRQLREQPMTLFKADQVAALVVMRRTPGVRAAVKRATVEGMSWVEMSMLESCRRI